MLYAMGWIYYPIDMHKLHITKSCFAFFIIILTMTSIFARCSRRGEDVDLTRDLPPRLAELLNEADDSTITLYAREVGIETFIDAKRHLEDLSKKPKQRASAGFQKSHYRKRQPRNQRYSKAYLSHAHPLMRQADRRQTPGGRAANDRPARR